MPAAAVIMFFSAMPKSKKRSGWRSLKSLVRLADARSAVRTTMRGSRSARSASSSPSTKAGIKRAGVPCTEALSLSEISPPPVPRKIASCSCAWGAGRVSAMGWLLHLAWLQARLDLGEGVVIVRAGEIADMPVERQLHACHAAALDGVGDDHLRRSVAGRLQSVERAEDRAEIMAVDALHVPAEAAEAIDQRLHLHDLLGRSVDAELVAVDDADEALQVEMSGRHRRFPDLALGQFAVAQHAVDAIAALLHARGQRHAHADREPMAERTRAEIDSGNLLHVRMIAERTAEPRVVVEQLRIEIAEVGENRIEPDGRVALAQDEAVAVRPLGIGGIEAQMGVVEGGEQLGGREGAGIVAGAADARQPQRLQPHELGAIGQEIRCDVAPARARARTHSSVASAASRSSFSRWRTK